MTASTLIRSTSATSPLRILTPGEVERFHERGLIKLESAFPREAALAMQAAMRRRLREIGIDQDDPTTWGIPLTGLRLAGRDPSFAAIDTPRLHHAIDDLIGQGRWSLPRSWGHFRATLPQPRVAPWTVPHAVWHLDCSLFEPPPLFVVLLFSDIAARGGATLMAEGSHRLIADFARRVGAAGRARKPRHLAAEMMRSHPWLQALTSDDPDPATRVQRLMSDTIDDAGVPLRVIETCGAAGDVWLCHATTLHSPSANHAEVPRFMRLKMLEFAPGPRHRR